MDLILWASERARSGNYNFQKCATRELGVPHMEDVSAALVQCCGSRVEAAELLGMSRPKLSKYIRLHPDLKDLVDSERDGLLDRVERSVAERALSGDWAAQKFILTTLGKDRGYTTKTEVETTSGGELAELLRASDKAHILPGDYIDITPEEDDDDGEAHGEVGQADDTGVGPVPGGADQEPEILEGT